jgi:hypothetical protein
MGFDVTDPYVFDLKIAPRTGVLISVASLGDRSALSSGANV